MNLMARQRRSVDVHAPAEHTFRELHRDAPLSGFDGDDRAD